MAGRLGPQLRDIKNETLVITGERDNYFPRYVYDDVAKLIPGAEVHDIGSAKHKVQLERHDAVNRAIERFVETSKRRTSWRSFQRRRMSSAGDVLGSATMTKISRIRFRFRISRSFVFWKAPLIGRRRRTATVFYGKSIELP